MLTLALSTEHMRKEIWPLMSRKKQVPLPLFLKLLNDQPREFLVMCLEFWMGKTEIRGNIYSDKDVGGFG